MSVLRSTKEEHSSFKYNRRSEALNPNNYPKAVVFAVKYVRRTNVAGIPNISQLRYLDIIITYYLDMAN